MTTFLYTLASFAVLTVLWFVFRPKGRITEQDLKDAAEAKRIARLARKQTERPS